MAVGRVVVDLVQFIGPARELLWQRGQNRMLGSSTHLIVGQVHGQISTVEVRVARTRRLGELIDDGVGGAGYQKRGSKPEGLLTHMKQ